MQINNREVHNPSFSALKISKKVPYYFYQDSLPALNKMARYADIKITSKIGYALNPASIFGTKITVSRLENRDSWLARLLGIGVATDSYFGDLWGDGDTITSVTHNLLQKIGIFVPGVIDTTDNSKYHKNNSSEFGHNRSEFCQNYRDNEDWDLIPAPECEGGFRMKGTPGLYWGRDMYGDSVLYGYNAYDMNGMPVQRYLVHNKYDAGYHYEESSSMSL